MTLKTPIYLFPVMLNISVESRELPRPQSHAITFWGTKEVIVESFRSEFTASLLPRFAVTRLRVDFQT